MSTRIQSVTCHPLRLPFDHGGPAPKFAGRVRTTLDSCLVRVTLDNGLVGWGEAYGAELNAMASIFTGRVAPLACGQDPTDPGLTAALDRILHNMGRSGLVSHALSGLDIALWDLRGKLAGQPLHALLGGAKRLTVPAYASLLQYYGDEALVSRNVQAACAAGYRHIKLHERTPGAVRAARHAMGPAMPLMVDVNCAWTASQAAAEVNAMRDDDPLWIEEPIWPPEDLSALMALREATGIPTAVGENASSLYELRQIIATGAADYLQPSAIKGGGVSVLWALSQACEGTSVRFSPQSAFFGPGFLATLHVLAAQATPAVIERLFCNLGFTPYARTLTFQDGAFAVPSRPGLGADPADETDLAHFAG
ncbi:mandelate racemase/muconate lactonizing enzyme family protein [Achromobacter sp. GG226]|uniref:mandelate racemase/muconate lactonizing enzyme family protein n=1 Tax=Verticiella alkaliphila TaxID=2779529 RepID=UPI001C0B4B3E|nr:mandelate racemase/muconate lactonizing enzyme family protein [Verticiella sp. GG226]MBU4609343.1 mandelate racemase/muconate lactonizing enzyme family protein [Verticiella sp. GG226]